eukprot:gene26754-32871_t
MSQPPCPDLDLNLNLGMNAEMEMDVCIRDENDPEEEDAELLPIQLLPTSRTAELPVSQPSLPLNSSTLSPNTDVNAARYARTRSKPVKDQLSNIKSSFTSHVQSLKNQGNLLKWSEVMDDDANLIGILTEHFEENVDEEGSSLRPE